MFDLLIWQWMLVGLVAGISVGYMSVTIIGMFSRKSAVPGTVRDGTGFESGIAGAPQPEDAAAFDAFSYRVTARFAGRVRIVVYPDRVAVSGPRVPRGLYRSWIWAQAMLLALVPAAVVAAIAALSWEWLVAAAALMFTSWAISTAGAGLWPGLGELEIVDVGRFRTVEFPRSSVDDVTVGEGWSRGGMETVLLPYKRGIDGLAGQRVVSFFAPGGDGHEVRYALHAYSDTAALKLAALLGYKVSKSGKIEVAAQSPAGV